ncbi:MAG TPA: DUF2200 family protein [Vicinamibacterales bacterium]|nr:DUF2200 family protein [Vicinamibacterales bacterium]
MDNHRVFKMSFASVYPHYVKKAEKKGRKKKEVDEVICWLTGYTPQALAAQIKQRKDFETFFRRGTGAESERQQDHRHYLRRSHPGDRASADAEDPVPGQAGG